MCCLQYSGETVVLLRHSSWVSVSNVKKRITKHYLPLKWINQSVSLSLPGDGKHILCGPGDNSLLLYKSSLTGNPTVYTGKWDGYEKSYFSALYEPGYMPSFSSVFSFGCRCVFYKRLIQRDIHISMRARSHIISLKQVKVRIFCHMFFRDEEVHTKTAILSMDLVLPYLGYSE